MSRLMLDHEAICKSQTDGVGKEMIQTTNHAFYIGQPRPSDGTHGIRLLGLPLELRLMIYKYLLPNKQTVQAKTTLMRTQFGPSGRLIFLRDNYLRTDKYRVDIAILLTCRQVYYEIVPDLLYAGRKFVVDIWMYEEIRLGVRKVSWECIRAFPFGQIQCLEVNICEPSFWNPATLFKIRQNICGRVESLARSPVLNEIIISPAATNWDKDTMRLGAINWTLILQPFILARARQVSFIFSVEHCLCCGCISGNYEATDAMVDFATDVGDRMESRQPWTRAERADVYDLTRMMGTTVEACFCLKVKAMLRHYRRPRT
ncbi:hypothetical protein MMC26_003473 [Xylographa opegraphella]|nr:hypothetical protein [Xylographa opegraphella]